MATEQRPMNQRTHSRTGSNGRKVQPSNARSSRPPPLTKKGHSHNILPTHGHGQGHSHAHTHKSSSASSKANSHDGASGDDEDEIAGMTSFLQFCTTCERQIVTPGTNILYCSESCRRKDMNLTISSTVTPITPLTPSTASYFDHYPVTDIIPQRSPTVPQPLSRTFSDMPGHDLSPVFDRSSATPRSRVDSHAASYLSQYLSDSASSHGRRQSNRNSLAGLESTIPSLVHSPSSSYGTVASNASYRPLPPRQNPFTSTFSTKSIDLVLPCHAATTPSSLSSCCKNASMKSSASTMTSYRVAEANDISRARRRSSNVAPDQCRPSSLDRP